MYKLYIFYIQQYNCTNSISHIQKYKQRLSHPPVQLYKTVLHASRSTTVSWPILPEFSHLYSVVRDVPARVNPELLEPVPAAGRGQGRQPGGRHAGPGHAERQEARAVAGQRLQTEVADLEEYSRTKEDIIDNTTQQQQYNNTTIH